MHTIEKTLVEHVRDFLNRSCNGKECTVVAAFSGGSDSLAMLVLLSQILDRNALTAVYVDHGLRSREELDREVLLNEQNCRKLGIRLQIERLPEGHVEDVARARDAGLEDAARYCRYKVLDRIREELGFGWIATAHTSDDQIETLVMRIFQGSGPAGLEGIRPVDKAVLRPLLGVSKGDLQRMLDDLGLVPSFDTTNHDLHFLRNAVRNKLIPVIREVFPGYVNACGNFMRKQHEVAEHVAHEVATCMWKVFRVDDQGVVLDPIEFNKTDDAVKEQLLHAGWALMGKGGTALSFRSVRYIRDALKSWQSGGKPSLHCTVQESELVVEGSLLRWRKDVLPVGQGWTAKICSTCTSLVEGYVLVRKPYDAGDPVGVAVIDESMLAPPLLVRSVACGDAICLSGGTVAVSKLIASWNIPKHRRNLVPVMEDRWGICAVLGSAFGGKDRISKRLILSTLAPNSCTLYSVMDMSFAREVGCTCCSPEIGGEMDKD